MTMDMAGKDIQTDTQPAVETVAGGYADRKESPAKTRADYVREHLAAVDAQMDALLIRINGILEEGRELRAKEAISNG